MDILNTFLLECNASAVTANAPMDASSAEAKPPSLEQVADEKKAEEARLLRAGGELLIAGCTDWDNSSSKGVQGLPGPHIIRLGSPVIKAFSSSSSCFAFFLLQDGRLFAMGSNSSGQLGLGDTVCHNGPSEVKTVFPAAVTKVATGKSHSLILLSNGEVFACGANNFGQCGLGGSAKAVQGCSTFTKVTIDPTEDIACGWDHSLLCTRNGHLYTFGHPNYGQLGNGTNGEYIREGKSGSMQYSCTFSPTHVRTFLCKNKNGSIKEEYSANNVKIYRVAAGRNHSVALEAEQSGGRVFTWGFGGYGRLGHNSAEGL
jgi:alpha-tubulin suppressor-like RCC1 family protein